MVFCMKQGGGRPGGKQRALGCGMDLAHCFWAIQPLWDAQLLRASVGWMEDRVLFKFSMTGHRME